MPWHMARFTDVTWAKLLADLDAVRKREAQQR